MYSKDNLSTAEITLHFNVVGSSSSSFPRIGVPMPATTRRAVRGITNLLTATPDEAALIIACALTDPRDLLRLALVCRRFFIKCIAAPSHRRGPAASDAAAAEATEMWSIIEEAARRWIANCTDQERGWVPRRGRESWLGLMWEVEVLRRRGAVFGRSRCPRVVRWRRRMIVAWAVLRRAGR